MIHRTIRQCDVGTMVFDSEIFSNLSNNVRPNPKGNKKTKDFGRKFMVSGSITRRKSKIVQRKFIVVMQFRRPTDTRTPLASATFSSDERRNMLGWRFTQGGSVLATLA
jgi:hypothetical protein